jgi:lipid A 3-O-deacylase PagL
MKAVWLVLALGAAASQWSCAEDVEWGAAGLRTGFSATSWNNNFWQREAFATHNLHWRWHSDSGWHLQTRLDLSAGALRRRGDEGFVGTLGPTLVLGKGDFPLTFEAGFSPTILSKDEFRGVNFGVPFQITSHAGFGCRIYKQLSAGYRFQHMSNVSISEHNPGLNLHLFELSYRF